MVSFLRHFGINSTVICCIAWIFWSTESKMISKKVGDEVTLNCTNTSVNMVVWKMNGKLLFSFRTANAQVHRDNGTNRPDLKFLDTPSQLYGLVIKNTQKLHEGNYTCEITINEGQKEQHWELLIKEEVEKLTTELSAVVAAVPCACFLIIITALVIFKCVQKRQTERNSGPPVFIRQQQPPEDIYENHLEIQRHAHALHHKPRPQ